MYVDASAMTALMLNESDRDELLEKLKRAPQWHTSVPLLYKGNDFALTDLA